MKIVFELNHPKHFYQFKYVMSLLKEHGHKLQIVARDKDVLLKVLHEEKIDYQVFGVHKKNVIMKLLAVIYILWSYFKILKKSQPDIIISKASLYSVLLSKFLKCKSIIFPDSEVVFLTNKIVAPLADMVITPETFELSYGKKHIRIPGLFENCYLHPTVFQFNDQELKELDIIKPYVVLRFIGWTANHDVGKKGISEDKKNEIVKLLKNNYHVYISSENELSDDLKEYSLKIPASKIHHVLYGAELYLGDSQTMATEAALLGTPSIRTNSFVGEHDMSNFKLLESKYHILRNVALDGNLNDVIDELTQPGKKDEWMDKRKKYFSSIGDTNMIIAGLIESVCNK
jgi:predicted glycosyltransferase